MESFPPAAINNTSLNLHQVSKTSNVDDSRKCSCEKTECLECSCDCFVAEMYCGDDCGCKDCCNTPDYEEAVEMARERIVSRNPQAFAPKIIPRLTQAPAIYSQASETSNVDDSKKCSCINTQCLKCYCVCFAAEMYCGNDCGCKDCCNRPDYDEAVEIAREKVKSRNPQAFSPMIIPPLTAPAIHSQDGDRPASLLGRRLRGCNCKNSLCSKNYCVCYQENVGCCDVCRCEGCQNKYGRRTGT